MINARVIERKLERESKSWDRKSPDLFVKGVRWGLALAKKFVVEEHRARAKGIDNSPTHWRPHVIRRMAHSAIAQIKSGEPGLARRILEKLEIQGLRTYNTRQKNRSHLCPHGV